MLTYDFKNNLLALNSAGKNKLALFIRLKICAKITWMYFV